MSDSAGNPWNPWLHRFAVLTALATLALVGLGGLVTSHGVGLAVPDWPNSYGYNMFFFPVSQWVGGIFYEHTHRLLASGVGALTGILALWLYGRKARQFMRGAGLVLLVMGTGTGLALPRHRADACVLIVVGATLLGSSFVWPRCEPSARWLRRLGVAAFFLVVLQGVLGGLRVVLLKDQIGIFHATLAQLFFVLMGAIALLTRKSEWEGLVQSPKSKVQSLGSAASALHIAFLGRLFLGATLLILGQLILGATMRHQHAGLAIPDFPLAYGRLWPATDPASVALYNQHRMEVVSVNPITGFQIVLQMAHRILAILVLVAVAVCAGSARRRLGSSHALSRLSAVWLGLILAQILLGAATIWSDKAADIATAHVLVGALSLGTGAWLSLLAMRSAAGQRAFRVSSMPEPAPRLASLDEPHPVAPLLGKRGLLRTNSGRP